MYIFDLDGTLIDSNNLWLQVDREFLARRGFVPTQEYTDLVTRSIFPIAARITIDYYHLSDSPETIMAEWESLAFHFYRHVVPLKPGAAALLKQLKERGASVVLFTAGRPLLCRAALEQHGLTGYFDRIIYAEEIGLEKHDPACFLRLSQLLGVPPSRCVLIDDSPENCATAKASGMDTIGVYDSFREDRQTDLQGIAKRYVRSLEALLED